MAKIIVIGCPGSGKSTMTFKLTEILNYPTMHLDKVYHIDNNTHISREELAQKVNAFASSHDNWIIDGNFLNTIEQRVMLADTIVLLNIDSKICVENALNRTKKARTADMAEGFDVTKISDGFLDFIANFQKDTLPNILDIIKKHEEGKKVYILNSYEEIDNFLKNIKQEINILTL